MVRTSSSVIIKVPPFRPLATVCSVFDCMKRRAIVKDARYISLPKDTRTSFETVRGEEGTIH